MFDFTNEFKKKVPKRRNTKKAPKTSREPMGDRTGDTLNYDLEDENLDKIEEEYLVIP